MGDIELSATSTMGRRLLASVQENPPEDESPSDSGRRDLPYGVSTGHSARARYVSSVEAEDRILGMAAHVSDHGSSIADEDIDRAAEVAAEASDPGPHAPLHVPSGRSTRVTRMATAVRTDAEPSSSSTDQGKATTMWTRLRHRLEVSRELRELLAGKPKEPIDVRKRLTLRLERPELLRGATTATLLQNFGYILSGGGSQTGTKKTKKEQWQSDEVDELDCFLSHSWHAWWPLKYMALLLYWNGMPATIAAVITGVIVFLVDTGSAAHHQKADTLKSRWLCYLDMYNCWQPVGGWSGYWPASLISGMSIFLLVICNWHHLLACRKKSPRIFLDKVCISQTNKKKKEAGIRAIGAILRSSRKVLVAWDPTYFERLWCVYEISAFKAAHQHGSESGGTKHEIEVVPIELGCLSFLVAVLGGFLNSLPVIFIKYGDGAKSIMLLVLGIMGILSIFWMVLHYMYSAKELSHKLKTFSLEKTKCFCCTVNHINPTTGDTMLCDRELVYESISYWYGGGSLDRKEGLHYFEQFVRGEVRRSMRRSIARTWTQVPYKHAIVISMPIFLLELDFKTGCDDFLHLKGLSKNQEHALGMAYELFSSFVVLFLRTPALLDMTFMIFACIVPKSSVIYTHDESEVKVKNGNCVSRFINASTRICFKVLFAVFGYRASDEMVNFSRKLMNYLLGTITTVPTALFMAALHEHFMHNPRPPWWQRVGWLLSLALLVWWQFFFKPDRKDKKQQHRDSDERSMHDRSSGGRSP